MAEDTNVSTNESDIQPGDLLEPTATEGSDVETSPVAGAADETVTDTEALEGSWILNLDDVQVSMVIYQSGALLFGAANSETPKAWNGVASGSAEEEVVELEILSLQDGVLVSTMISGIATEGTLSGSFVQSDSEGKVNEGKAMGFLTSPDTSGYEPADVPTTAATAAAAVVTPAPESTTTASAPAETTDEGRKKPLDVASLKEQYIAVGAGAPMPL